MAGPLYSVGAQSQVSTYTSTAQASQVNARNVREQAEQVPKPERIQPQGSAAAEAQKPQADNQNLFQQVQAEAFIGANALDPTENPRGSLLDIRV
ncbi:MAG: hypothetical protein ACPGRX_05315 [Bdellovibrionales bacterium]